MKFKKEFIIIPIVLIMLTIMIFANLNKRVIYSRNIFYMDTYINVKIFSKKDKKVDNILNNVESIYKEYHELTDRFKSYDNTTNIYTINNENNSEYLEIDKRLYDILSYSLKWQEKSDGLFNIELGNVIGIWKKYINNERLKPTIYELKKAYNNSNKLILLDDNKVINNGVNLDLGAIAKGYTTGIVGEYLKEQGYNKFIINAGGQVLVGDKYHESPYKIGVKNPNDEKNNFIIVVGENISVATSGGYERFVEEDGKKYHHIINPKTLYPSDFMKSVTVISKDSKLTDTLTTLLFTMSIEEGMKYVEDIPDVEVLWYSHDNVITKSKGFDKYEQK